MLLVPIARNCVRALLLLAVSMTSAADGNGRPAKTIVAPCTGITLSASYLADMAPDHGPGFLFRIENRTAHAIRLAKPVPSSTHWYARVGKRWLWRASAGRGGALVDALRERGPMFAYSPNTPPDDPQYLLVPAHETRQWSEPMLRNDSIAYRPSCPKCNYPGEDEYEAIFAYAYLPNDAEHAPDLLRCGLRSAPVPMPPHSSADLSGAH